MVSSIIYINVNYFYYCIKQYKRLWHSCIKKQRVKTLKCKIYHYIAFQMIYSNRVIFVKLLFLQVKIQPTA